MDYQNITLSVPKNILIKVKHIAVDKRKSVSQLLVESMEEMAMKNDFYEEAMKRNTKLFEKNSLGTNGILNTSKEDLHG